MSMATDVATTCEALFMPAQVVELRVLEVQGTKGFKFNAAGWFNNMQALAEAAAEYSKRNPSGIYATINPLHRACLARTDNTMVDRLKDTSSDNDITARHWFPIDLDPVRPSGVSASQDELENAKNIAQKVVAYLEDELGFPPGLKAHSGNGIHLLYRIDLLNDQEGKDIVKGSLHGLATKFNTLEVKVDTSLINAARIMRLWGTPTRKGRHVEERPHRTSKLWTPKKFEEIQVVSAKQLAKLIELDPNSEKTAKKTKKTKKKSKKTKKTATAVSEHLFDLDGWIDRFKIAVKRTEPFDGSGIRHILECCLFDPSHTKTSAALGRAPSGAIFYKCQHDSCTNNGWAEAKALFQDSAAKTDDPEVDSPWELARAFLNETYCNSDLGKVTLRRHRESYFVYSAKRRAYVSVSHDRIKIDVTRWLAENEYPHTTKKLSDVINALSSLVTVPEELEMPFMANVDIDAGVTTADPRERNMISLKNGILDVDAAMAGTEIENCLLSHTPEWFTTTSLQFSFPTNEIEAACPLWLAFLDEILESDQERIRIIQEMFGYCFWRSTSLEKFFILQGRGRNGKSTLLDILELLLGESNVTNLSLDQLADPTLRFELYQKVANICNDLPEMDRVEEGLIKRVTSGEAIVCNRKYKDAIRFKPRAKLIFSTNPLPRFTDTSLGIWRRMILVPFEYVVPSGKVDVNLRHKLKMELPGILLWALSGAVRLAEEGRFSKSEVCAGSNRDYKLQCFPILTFLEECTVPSGQVIAKDLWKEYRNWCRAFGLSRPKPLHPLIRDVVGFWPNIQYPRVSSAMTSEITLSGISLKPNLNYEEMGPTNPPASSDFWQK